MKFLQYQRYLDKGKTEKTLNINPLMVTIIEKGDQKQEVCIWMAGAYGPIHVVGDVKLIKLAVETAITKAMSNQ